MSIDIKRARQIARLALLYLAHYADSSQAAEAFRPDDVEWGDDTLELDVCGRRMFDAQAAELTQILSRSRRKGNRRTSEILHLALHLFDPCLEDAEALAYSRTGGYVLQLRPRLRLLWRKIWLPYFLR